MFPMNLENQQFLESQDNTYNLITLILGVLPKIKIDICLHNDLYKNGHKVFVTNNQKHEKTQVFNQLKINELWYVYTQSGIQLTDKMQQITNICTLILKIVSSKEPICIKEKMYISIYIKL